MCLRMTSLFLEVLGISFSFPWSIPKDPWTDLSPYQSSYNIPDQCQWFPYSGSIKRLSLQTSQWAPRLLFGPLRELLHKIVNLLWRKFSHKCCCCDSYRTQRRDLQPGKYPWNGASPMPHRRRSLSHHGWSKLWVSGMESLMNGLIWSTFGRLACLQAEVCLKDISRTQEASLRTQMREVTFRFWLPQQLNKSNRFHKLHNRRDPKPRDGN